MSPAKRSSTKSINVCGKPKPASRRQAESLSRLSANFAFCFLWNRWRLEGEIELLAHTRRSRSAVPASCLQFFACPVEEVYFGRPKCNLSRDRFLEQVP